MIFLAAFVALIAPAVLAQQSLWGQCGGIGYTGETTCVSGSTCVKINDYYSQCQPGTAATSATTAPTSTASSPQPTAPSSDYKYLFSFGDSYTQTGFEIYLAAPSVSNPLGNPDFPGWTSSGGTNWIGYLINEYNESVTLAYNFAYGGATIDANIVPPYISTVRSLVDQVGIFLDSAQNGSIPALDDQALFSFWIGINDIGGSYYQSVDQDALHNEMMDVFFDRVQELYDVGARKFLFLTVPPIQKTPLMIAQGTAAQENEAVQIADFNDKVTSRASAFQVANSGATTYVYDTEPVFDMIIANPTAYGYADATSYCEASTCMWWNNYHPAAGVHKVLAEDISKAIASLW